MNMTAPACTAFGPNLKTMSGSGRHGYGATYCMYVHVSVLSLWVPLCN